MSAILILLFFASRERGGGGGMLVFHIQLLIGPAKVRVTAKVLDADRDDIR